MDKLAEDLELLKGQVQSLTEDNSGLTIELKMAREDKVKAWEGVHDARKELRASLEENIKTREELLSAKGELVKLKGEVIQRAAKAREAELELKSAQGNLSKIREDYFKLQKESGEKEKSLEDEILTTWAKGWVAHQCAAMETYPDLKFDFSPPGEDDIGEEMETASGETDQVDPSVEALVSGPATEAPISAPDIEAVEVPASDLPAEAPTPQVGPPAA